MPRHQKLPDRQSATRALMVAAVLTVLLVIAVMVTTRARKVAVVATAPVPVTAGKPVNITESWRHLFKRPLPPPVADSGAEPRNNLLAEPSPPPMDPSGPPVPPGWKPVVDLGTVHAEMENPSAEPPAPDRIEPTEEMPLGALRYPQLFFEATEGIPEYQREEERQRALGFFYRYRVQLEGDADRLRADGVSRDSEELKDLVAAIERYDAAIQKLEGLMRADGQKVEPRND